MFAIWLERNVLEFALRSVAAEHSESPMYLVFPALRISSRAGMDSVRGVSISISNCKLEDNGPTHWGQSGADSTNQE
jgi:hypothetical protein